MSLTYGTNRLTTLRATFLLFLCTVVCKWVSADVRCSYCFFFLFYSLLFFSTFSFYVFATLTVLYLFLGASLVCGNNLKRTADLVLWFPHRTAVCTHPWHGHLYNLIYSIENVVKPYCCIKKKNLKNWPISSVVAHVHLDCCWFLPGMLG